MQAFKHRLEGPIRAFEIQSVEQVYYLEYIELNVSVALVLLLHYFSLENSFSFKTNWLLRAEKIYNLSH